MKRFTIDIHPEDIVNNFTKDEIIKLYGGESFLLADGGVFIHRLILQIDTDSLLEAIGTEGIVAFLKSETDANVLRKIVHDLNGRITAIQLKEQLKTYKEKAVV